MWLNVEPYLHTFTSFIAIAVAEHDGESGFYSE